MSVKPILFNTEMVRAILDGRKTVTRRCVKPPRGIEDVFGHMNECKQPCQPGDILYVRETWQYAHDMDGNDQIIEGTGRYLYCAENPMPFNDWIDPDTGEHKEHMPWKPSIHMPKEAARIWLKVTGVRVERLQCITEEQAIKEGFEPGSCQYEGAVWGQEDVDEWTAKTVFIELWDSIIPRKDLDKYGWDANPWVWVIEFEWCEKPKEE